MPQNFIFYIDMLIILLILIIPFIVLSVIMKFKKSAIGILFVYLFIGVIFLGVSSILVFVPTAEILKLDDIRFHVLWHSIFYLAMIGFILGGAKSKNLTSLARKEVSHSKDHSKDINHISIFLVLSIIGLILFFIVAKNSNDATNSLFVFFDKTGFHHFIAFLLAGISSSYFVFLKKNFGQLFSIIAVPILIALALFSLQHFWELLTENWQIIALTESFIEGTEKLIIMPAYILILISFIKARKFLAENL